MSGDKEKDNIAGTDEEKTALKIGDTSVEGDDSMLDNSRARFITGGSEKGDGALPEVYVDVEGKTKLEDEFVGLTKEELMKFADDPKWIKIRRAFLIIFWVGWFAMLAAAIIIIVLAPKCPPKPKLEWWQTSDVYEVFTKSFKDSDGDGIGDLNGVHEKLDYLSGNLESLNVSAVVLSSIYPHGGTSSGYDVTNFVDIDPEFGTLDDFYNLRVAMHKKGLKVILDFIPNHTGKGHTWFEKSQKKEGKYADYYVWKTGPPSSSGRPNDWRSTDGTMSWKMDNVRGEYYLHQFSEDQPDLNLRNEDVRAELETVLMFWLEKGVDGFRVNGADYLFECTNFTNEETCQKFQPESYEIITDWREIIDEFGKKEDKNKFLMVQSSGTVNQTVQYYEFRGIAGAHAPVNTQLLTVAKGCEAECLLGKITSWVSVTSAGNRWNNWQLGNQDINRVASRLENEEEQINIMNMILLTLPGTVFTYYGDELGMHDLPRTVVVKAEEDRYRSPMQWSPDKWAGFTEGNTSWLEPPSDANIINVKSQLAHGAGLSTIEIYSHLTALRTEPSFQWGNLEIGVAGNTLFYIRQATGFPGFLVAVNPGPSESTVDFIHSAPNGVLIPNSATVVANTGNFVSSNGEFDIGAKVDLSNLLLREKQGVIFRWEKAPEK